MSAGKKPKGSSKIKRPMNAFMVWSSVERKKIAEKEPRMHNTDISKRLGLKWKAMTENEKLPYRCKADKLKSELMEEHPDYKYKPRRKRKVDKVSDAKSKAKRISYSSSPQNLFPSAAASEDGVPILQYGMAHYSRSPWHTSAYGNHLYQVQDSYYPYTPASSSNGHVHLTSGLSYTPAFHARTCKPSDTDIAHTYRRDCTETDHVSSHASYVIDSNQPCLGDNSARLSEKAPPIIPHLETTNLQSLFQTSGSPVLNVSSQLIPNHIT